MWASSGPLASCHTSGLLCCHYEYFMLLKLHPLIMGKEGGVVASHAPQLTSLMWLGVIFFSFCPLVSAPLYTRGRAYDW